MGELSIVQPGAKVVDSRQKRVCIDVQESFILEINRNDTVVAELEIQVKELEWQVMTGNSKVGLYVVNRNPIEDSMHQTSYLS